MSSPFFSIVIPVYNRGEILVDRLTYLFNQTFKDFEVLIIDDGSKGFIEEVLRSLLGIHSNLRVIRQDNKERGAARNLGIHNSLGEYVILFDSDDWMHKDHLAALYAGIEKNNQPDFIATKFNFKNADGKVYDSDICTYHPGEYDFRLFLNGNPLACNICFRREQDNLILFEEDRNYAIKEDWMFLISNLRHNKLILLNDVTISMFEHEDRSMRSGNKKIIEKTIHATEWIRARIDLTGRETLQLFAHRDYFCGIHSYLDNDRKHAIKFSLSAMRSGGIKKKYVVLLIKSIIGRKIIKKIGTWL
jgi:GalNAc5-diNAcBac-PP-undecaprenol beta-1,3-glucosyltransferase